MTRSAMTIWAMCLGAACLVTYVVRVLWFPGGVDVDFALLEDPTRWNAGWFGAIGTLVAAVGTVAAIGVSLHQSWRLQIEREQELKVGQAKRVFSQFTTNGKECTATIGNASEEPIYDCLPWFDNDGEIPRYQKVTTVAPGGHHAFPQEKYDSNTSSNLVSITFCDNAGRWWRRHVDGRLAMLQCDPTKREV